MKRKNTTRNALFTSILSLLLCVSMLVGTTFAWFTDSVTSGVNNIAAGNLDVELYHSKDKKVEINDKNEVGPETLLFTDVNGAEIKHWEPGVVAYTNLRVANVGTLALKYQLSVNATEMNYVQVDGSVYTLADALKVAIVKDGFAGERAEAQALAEELWQPMKSFTLAGELEGDETSDVYGIVIYWEPGENDNIFNINNNKTTNDGEPLAITLGVNLFATQEMYESDSFGDDYDKNAWADGMEVFTAADLQAAVANGQSVVLKSDLELTESLTVPAGVDIVINLNGYTLTGTVGRDEEGSRVHTLVNNGTLVLVNGTVKSGAYDGGSAVYNAAGANLVLQDVTVLGAPQENPVYPVSNYPSYAVNNYGTMTVNNVTVKSYYGAIATCGEGATVINKADVEVGMGNSTGITSYAVYSTDNAKVTVNSGTFAFTKNEDYVYGGCLFCGMSTEPVEVNGGIFTGEGFRVGDSFKYTVSGGQFSERVDKAYLAEGYQCSSANGVYVVKKPTDKLVFLAADLKAALNSTETTKVILVGDIDLGSESLTVATGAAVELELNGCTITGAETATGSFGLININPGAELTINDTIGTGAITLTAATDRDWNAYSSVISNQRGKLTVNGGVIEHLGGTDMAYAIDNLTNGKGTYAETVINGGVIKSTYRAIRQFLNGIKADNILTVNGGTIEGANKSIWMQDPSKNANTGTLTVAQGANLIGDIYLFVTAGSTEWPVNIAIAEAVVDEDSQLLTGNVPEGYVLEVRDGKYIVYKSVAAEDALVSEGETLELGANVQIQDAPIYSNVDTEEPVTIDGNGHTVYGEVSSVDAFQWDGNVPEMSTIFSSKDGAKVTVNDMTFTGTMSAVMAGNYVNSTANYFNTEFNNVNILNAEVVSFSAGISPALAVYGSLTMNGCNIYGTTLSELDTDPMWPVYDVAVTNYSNTVINDSKIGSLYMWNQAKVTVADGTEVDTIVVRGNMNTTKYGLVIEAGAVVGTIDLTNIADAARINITIAEGATVGAIVDDGVSYDSLDAWKAAQ